MTVPANKKTIIKYCATLRAAERHQDRLYAQYDSVTLVQFPRFSEEGDYSWEVSNKEGR